MVDGEPRVAEVFESTQWQSYSFRETTDRHGIATFGDLPPMDGYQLYVSSEVLGSECLFDFEARLSPLSGTRANGKNVKFFDSSFDTNRLLQTSLSGFIPVKANNVTSTVVWKHAGSSVTGLVVAGAWDKSVVVLSRIRDGLELELEKWVDQVSFRSKPVLAGGVYRLWATFQSEPHYYFFAQRFMLRDAENRDFGVLNPVDPTTKCKIHVDVVDEKGIALQPGTVFDGDAFVNLTVRRMKPEIRADLRIAPNSSVFIHGMTNLKVIRARFEGSTSPSWEVKRIKELVTAKELKCTVVVGLVDQAVRSKVRVEIIPPLGILYTEDVYVEIVGRDGQSLDAVSVSANTPSQDMMLPLGAKVKARLRARGRRGRNLSEILGSERLIENIIVRSKLTIRDPGPPNGLGISRR